jgi:preprotein translocase subunit SecA
MLNALVKQISKLFGGSKSERDVKQLMPIVEQINAHYAEYLNLSNDALRAKTTELKQRLKDELSVFDEKINAIKAEINELAVEEVLRKDEMYSEIEAIEKEKNVALEILLMQILPEAFAVVKATAKLFSDNASVSVTATERDIELAKKRNNVRIDGQNAIYANEW